MKYSLLILAFTLTCGFCVSAAGPAPDAKAKAKAEADAKAKAKAETDAKAKAKAEADAKRAVNRKWQDDTTKFAKLLESGTSEEIRKCLNDAVPNCVRPGAPDMSRSLSSFIDRMKSTVSKAPKNGSKATWDDLIYAYKLFLGVVKEGDSRATLLNGLADVYKTQKKGTDEEIKKLKAEAYRVPGISRTKLFALYAADNDLVKADQIAADVVKEAEEKAAKLEPRYAKNVMNAAWRQIIGTFKDKKVFGSPYAAKWMKVQADKAATPDEKAVLTTEYIKFLDEYALESVENISKMRADRYNIPGLTDAGRVDLLISDFTSGLYSYQITNYRDPDVYIPLREKAVKTAGNNFALRCKVYDAAIKDFNNAYTWRNVPTHKMEDFCRNVILQDPEVLKDPRMLRKYITDYVKCYSFGVPYAENEKFLLELQKKLDLTNPLIREAWRMGMAFFYETYSKRYYESPDPMLNRKALDLYRQVLTDALPKREKEGDNLYKSRILSIRASIARYAWFAGDYTSVKDQLKALDEPPFKGIDDSRSDALRDIRMYAGYVAFEEGRYKDAEELLIKVQESLPGYVTRLQILNTIIRSALALEDYPVAIKYTELTKNKLSDTRKTYYEMALERIKKLESEKKK